MPVRYGKPRLEKKAIVMEKMSAGFIETVEEGLAYPRGKAHELTRISIFMETRKIDWVDLAWKIATVIVIALTVFLVW